MPLPESLRIGPFVYKISFEHMEEDHGAFFHNTCKICLDPAIEPQIIPEILLHEVLHAIVYNSVGTTLADKEEERMVAMLSPGLMAVLRDNPEFMEFIANGT